MGKSNSNIIIQSTGLRKWRYELPYFLPTTQIYNLSIKDQEILTCSNIASESYRISRRRRLVYYLRNLVNLKKKRRKFKKRRVFSILLKKFIFENSNKSNYFLSNSRLFKTSNIKKKKNKKKINVSKKVWLFLYNSYHINFLKRLIKSFKIRTKNKKIKKYLNYFIKLKQKLDLRKRLNLKKRLKLNKTLKFNKTLFFKKSVLFKKRSKFNSRSKYNKRFKYKRKIIFKKIKNWRLGWWKRRYRLCVPSSLRWKVFHTLRLKEKLKRFNKKKIKNNIFRKVDHSKTLMSRSKLKTKKFKLTLRILPYLKWRSRPIVKNTAWFYMWKRSFVLPFRSIKNNYIYLYNYISVLPLKTSWWNMSYDSSIKAKFYRRGTKSGKIYKRSNSVLVINF